MLLGHICSGDPHHWLRGTDRPAGPSGTTAVDTCLAPGCLPMYCSTPQSAGWGSGCGPCASGTDWFSRCWRRCCSRRFWRPAWTLQPGKQRGKLGTHHSSTLLPCTLSWCMGVSGGSQLQGAAQLSSDEGCTRQLSRPLQLTRFFIASSPGAAASVAVSANSLATSFTSFFKLLTLIGVMGSSCMAHATRLLGWGWLCGAAAAAASGHRGFLCVYHAPCLCLP